MSTIFKKAFSAFMFVVFMFSALNVFALEQKDYIKMFEADTKWISISIDDVFSDVSYNHYSLENYFDSYTLSNMTKEELDNYYKFIVVKHINIKNELPSSYLNIYNKLSDKAKRKLVSESKKVKFINKLQDIIMSIKEKDANTKTKLEKYNNQVAVLEALSLELKALVVLGYIDQKTFESVSDAEKRTVLDAIDNLGYAISSELNNLINEYSKDFEYIADFKSTFDMELKNKGSRLNWKLELADIMWVRDGIAESFTSNFLLEMKWNNPGEPEGELKIEGWFEVISKIKSVARLKEFYYQTDNIEVRDYLGGVSDYIGKYVALHSKYEEETYDTILLFLDWDIKFSEEVDIEVLGKNKGKYVVSIKGDEFLLSLEGRKTKITKDFGNDTVLSITYDKDSVIEISCEMPGDSEFRYTKNKNITLKEFRSEEDFGVIEMDIKNYRVWDFSITTKWEWKNIDIKSVKWKIDWTISVDQIRYNYYTGSYIPTSFRTLIRWTRTSEYGAFTDLFVKGSFDKNVNNKEDKNIEFLFNYREGKDVRALIEGVPGLVFDIDGDWSNWNFERFVSKISYAGMFKYTLNIENWDIEGVIWFMDKKVDIDWSYFGNNFEVETTYEDETTDEVFSTEIKYTEKDGKLFMIDFGFDIDNEEFIVDFDSNFDLKYYREGNVNVKDLPEPTIYLDEIGNY